MDKQERTKLTDERKAIKAKDKPTAADKKRLEEIESALSAADVAKAKELAEKRVTTAIKALENVANLGKRRKHFTGEQVEAISNALTNALKRVGAAFEGESKSAGFKL